MSAADREAQRIELRDERFVHARGMWGMACWNGLSAEQQERLVTWGNLPIGYEPRGECLNGAEVEVTTMWDRSPGPRFYCVDCALGYLALVKFGPVP